MTHEAEPTTPNSGRMLDYWLGGRHHYPVDLAGVKVFEAVFPEFPRMFRVLRDFIGRTSRYIHEQGVDQFLVLGAGVPTQGNVHEVVPGARVVYTDNDPHNIALGQRILAGVPGTGYTHCDAGDLTTLDMAEVTRVLGPIRRLGIIMIGVECFLADEPLRATLQKLHEMAPPGSYLAVDCDNAAVEHNPELLKMMGPDFHMRTAEQLAAALGPWELTEEGIKPVASWRPEGAPVDVPPYMIGGVARKP